ncbi:MAG: hypothetical protein L0221_09685, partial [Chloroflexi bacterium]|nr:hypothetical protein [Chloroflexota bacterium]
MPDRTSSMPPESDVLAGPHASPADHGEGHGHDDHAHAGEAIALGLGRLDSDGDEIGMGLSEKAFCLFLVFNAHAHGALPWRLT